MRRLLGMVVTATSLASFWLAPSALAQKASDYIDQRPPTTGDTEAPATEALAAPAKGPVIYVCDKNNLLGTVDVGAKSIHVIGNLGTQCTDIAFDPKTGVLYGINFGSLYKIDPKNAHVTFISGLGASGLNALVFDKTGRCLTEGRTKPDLYELDIKTGQVVELAQTGPFHSAGDLAFYNNQLILSATGNSLVTINPTTFQWTSAVPINVNLLYGLASVSKDDLIGFANTSVYQINPTAPKIADRAVLLFSFAGKGLAQIQGAAFSGYNGP